MRDVLELDNTVLPYPWGSRTRIAELLGRAARSGEPVGEPQAEMWMGAHPKAPSRVVVAGESRGLDRLIAENPVDLLGEELGRLDEPRLPYLFKVLAAERALSIQAHPGLAQAAAGFDREDRAGVPIAADERNYRDRNHKPEVLFAIEPFWVLRGFRAEAKILALVERLDLPPLARALATLRRATQTGAPGDGLQSFFAATLRFRQADLEQFNRQVVAAITSRGLAADPVYRWVLRLVDQFPADRGVLAPLFLNILRLEPGQAIFTGPGILHAYLEGFGVELMANSDNVLRGGLTTKHVDVGELLSILHFEEQVPEILQPELSADGCERRFAPAVPDFALTELSLRPGQPRERTVRAAEILLVLRGEGFLRQEGGREIPFRRGQSFFVPAAAGSYQLEGDATLFRAEPGQLS